MSITHARTGRVASCWPRKTLRRGACGCNSPTRSCAARWRPARALDETELARRFQRVAHAGARGDPPAGGERAGRGARAPRRAGGAADARASRRHVRGDGRARSALRRLCRRAHERRRAPRAGGHAREAARADPERRSAALSRGQRGLPRLHLCRRAQPLSRRTDADDARARAAVPPRPVPHSRAARQVASTSTTAWCRRSCAATAPAAAAACTRTSSPCARNTSTIPRRFDLRRHFRSARDTRASRRSLEMSRAPAVAAASTRKPLTLRPSRELRRCRSTSAAAPRRRRRRRLRPAAPRPRPRSPRPCRRRRASRPGFAGCAAVERKEPVDRPRSVVVSSRRPPSARNSPLSGRPERCAPTTATRDFAALPATSARRRAAAAAPSARRAAACVSA